jgi:type IV secretion system protein VirB10
VLRVERAASRQEPRAEEAKPVVEGSGRFLPAREGDLFRLYEGSLVQTRLVNRLDGSFTGPVKCEVVAPVTSVDGKVVLIPKGALFLGEARRVDSQNQRRLAVTFRRLLLPNGYSVDLKNAPGLNGVGETGLSDKVNNHYLQAFGASGAIGVLSGLALYGGRAGAFGFRSGVVSGTGSATTSVLNRYLNVLPTVTIREGHEVNVYISNDLLLPAYKR